MPDPIRLAHRVAELAGCSRADAEQYIQNGWVSVHGRVVEAPQHPVTSERVPASERISDVADWNRQLPSQPIRIAWRERDWQQISSWEMPTFYVFRDGKLLTQWSGWAADSGLDTLRRRLQDAGVTLAPFPVVPEES